jgi:glycosyltransferase involved in cell wall biosynthesis
LPVRLACRAGADRRQLLHATIARFLRRHRVSYVLGEYLDQFADFAPLLDRMGVPYVVQGHGLDVSGSLATRGAGASYAAYKSAKAVLTRCEFHRQRLISIGLPAERIHVNPGGVDIPAAPPQRGPAAAKRFLAIGRMAPQKAPILLLEAFRLAAARDPDLTLDYVGGGALYPAVWQFVQGCGLQDRVRLHGVASEAEKERLLGECGVFVQHSATDPETGDEEGLPAAIQEAMAHAMAVVSTRHSGIPEAVIEGETGLLGDEGDVGAMAAAFLAVPEQAARLGAAGYRRAAANYGWEHERARLRQWLFGDGDA